MPEVRGQVTRGQGGTAGQKETEREEGVVRGGGPVVETCADPGVTLPAGNSQRKRSQEGSADVYCIVKWW